MQVNDMAYDQDYFCRRNSLRLRQKAQHPERTLHQLTLQPQQPKNMKQTLFHNTNYTTNRDTTPDTTTLQAVENNTKRIHKSSESLKKKNKQQSNK